jgi:hypothetical protein
MHYWSCWCRRGEKFCTAILEPELSLNLCGCLSNVSVDCEDSVLLWCFVTWQARFTSSC